MVFSVILYLLQKTFFPVTILNEPLSFIFISVLILVATSVYFTRHRFLFSGQSSTDKMKTRVLVVGFNTFKYVVAFGTVYYFCFLSGFNVYSKYIGSLEQPEFYSIPITQVNKGSSRSSPSIGFYFKGCYNILSGNQFYEILKIQRIDLIQNRN